MLVKQIVFTIVLALICVVLYSQSRWLEYPTSVYLDTLLAMLAVVTCFHAAGIVRKRKELMAVVDTMSPASKKRLRIAALAAVGYVVALEIVGFYATSFFYFVGMVHFFNPHPSKKTFAVALSSGLAGTVVLYLLFSTLLSVPTPDGILL